MVYFIFVSPEKWMFNMEPDFSVLMDLPEIETKRLLLRRITMEDAEQLFECFGDEETADNMQFRLICDIEEQRKKISQFIEDYEAGESARWCTVLRESGEVIGSVMLFSVNNATRAAVGFFINRRYRNKGYAKEMLNSVIDFGFNKIHLNRIEGEHFIENPASGKVMKSCNMRCEGEFLDYYFINGRQRTVKRYVILSSEYEGFDNLNK